MTFPDFPVNFLSMRVVNDNLAQQLQDMNNNQELYKPFPQNTEIASMSNVVIEKSKLLEILKENKSKHNTIFEIAKEGFWDEVKNKLELKRKEFAAFLAEVQSDFDHAVTKIEKKLEIKDEKVDSNLNIRFNFNGHLGLAYPENYSKDYDRAIRLVELSVYDKVSLNSTEFEQYVLNNWTWKEKFLASNSGYVGNVRNRSALDKSALIKSYETGGFINGGEFVMNKACLDNVLDSNTKLEF